MSQATLAALLSQLQVTGGGGSDLLAQEIVNASGGFGSNTQINLPDNTAALVEAWRQLIEFRVNTAGAVESRVRTFLELASAETEVGGFAYNSAAFPIIYLGPLADNNFIRRTSAGTWDLNAGGVGILGLSSTLVTANNGLQCLGRIQEAQAGAVAVATTITWGAGNAQLLTVGTGTLNSITMTGLIAGFRGVLMCPSGVTITNNVAGTGATILTPSGASIVTAAKRAIPVYYDGTNVIVEG